MAIAPPPPAPASAAIPERPDRRWPFLEVDAGMFWALALAPFGIVMLAYLMVLGFFGWDGDGGAVLLTLLQQLALALPIALWVRGRSGSLEPLGLRRGGWSRRDIGVGIGMGLLALVAGLVVLLITVAVVEAILGHPYTYPDSGLEGAWFWAFAVMAVGVAPTCEELYFRGFVFQGLRRWSRFAWAGLASGAMFAFVHVEPIRFFSLWLTGLLFAAMFERRKTLVANICAHTVLNVVAIAVAASVR